MKKFAMVLITLLLAFGFTSTTFAHDNHQDDDEKVTYSNGVTTIVKTTKEVTYDKVVKRKKYSEYVTEKKHDMKTYEEVDVAVSHEHHPRKDWYRDVETRTTYEVTKHMYWDQVTRYDTIKTYTTPVKMTKTTVTTTKKYGKPNRRGKVFFKETETFYDKEYGDTKHKVVKKQHVTNKNYETKYDKKVINVEVNKGKWIKDDHEHHDGDN